MKQIGRSHVAPAGFNRELRLPYELRVKDFDLAMQDVTTSSSTSTATCLGELVLTL